MAWQMTIPLLSNAANNIGFMAKILSLQLGSRRCLRTIGARQNAAPLHWVLLTVPLIVSPSGADDALPEKPPRQIAIAATAASRVTFQTLLKGYRSAVREPLQAAARNQADWKALWGKHVSTEPNAPALPAVDFSREIVVAVFLGEKPTGGHDIEITNVEQRDGNLTVSFIEKSPPPGGLVTQAFTQPFHMVRVAAQSSGTVSFRRLP